MKTCLYCQGDLEERTITLDKRWGGELFIIEDLPALVCKQCGEKFFDGPVVEQVDEMVKTRNSVIREITVPVMKFKVA